MPKHRNSVMPSWQATGYVALAIVLAAIMVVSLRPRHARAPTANASDPSRITITTADGVQLAGTIKFPPSDEPSPVVILLHQYGQDRHQWDPYLTRFLAAGLVVLSYDMRGFGDSRLAAIPPDQQTHLASLPKDLPAVMSYLQQRPAVDRTKINIIGASIGADVAFIASGSDLGIHRTVMLSPVVRGAALDGHDVTGFSPHGVYGLASNKEQADLKTYMANVADPKQQLIVPNGGHGMELLSTAGLLDGLIAWIKTP